MLLFNIILDSLASSKPGQRNRKYQFENEGIMLILFIGDVDYLHRKSKRLYKQINRIREFSKFD